MTTPQSFPSDAHHLDLVAHYLRARARRIGLQLQAEDNERAYVRPGHRTLGHQDQLADKERERRIAAAEGREHALLRELEAREEVHRRSSKPPLGIDQICEGSRLGPQERLVLLAAAVVAISERIAQQVVEPLDVACMMRLTVEGAIRLLEPEDGLVGCVAARRMFTAHSALVSSGLLVVEHCSPAAVPDALPGAYLAITSKAFTALTGLNEIEDKRGQGHAG